MNSFYQLKRDTMINSNEVLTYTKFHMSKTMFLHKQLGHFYYEELRKMIEFGIVKRLFQKIFVYFILRKMKLSINSRYSKKK